MELELTIGGIKYQVDLDIDDEYVCGVLGVKVYSGKEFINIKLSRQELKDFYNAYEDILNESYQDYLDDSEEIYLEEKWERDNDR